MLTEEEIEQAIREGGSVLHEGVLYRSVDAFRARTRWEEERKNWLASIGPESADHPEMRVRCSLVWMESRGALRAHEVANWERQLYARPYDDVLRRNYAGWLEERGCGRRAQAVRLASPRNGQRACALAALARSLK